MKIIFNRDVGDSPSEVCHEDPDSETFPSEDGWYKLVYCVFFFLLIILIDDVIGVEY